MAEQVQSGLDAVESPKEEITAVGGPVSYTHLRAHETDS